MENLAWEPIRSFLLEGVINDDAQIAQRKKDYIELLGIQMRSTGYARRLDIPEDFSLEYNVQNDTYNFSLVIYGVYVGERESEWIYGVDEDGPIPIPQSRSNESYSEAA